MSAISEFALRNVIAALTYNVPKCTRMISFEEQGNSRYRIHFVLERKPTEDEIDFMNSAASELDGRFPHAVDCESDFVVFVGLIDDVPVVGKTLFAMSE